MQRMKPSRTSSPSCDPYKDSNLCKAHGPTASIPQNSIEVSASKAFRIKKRGLKQSLLHARFLLSKVKWTGEWLSPIEEAVLLERMYQVQSYREFHWLQKNASQIKDLTKCLTVYLKNRSKRSCAGVQLLFECQPYSKAALLPGHEYFGLESSLVAERELQPIDLTRKTKTPPRRVVGVGYRDHGTYRDTSKYGTPAWQEVAASHQMQETSQLRDSERWLENLRLFVKIAGWEALQRAGPDWSVRQASYLS